MTRETMCASATGVASAKRGTERSAGTRVRRIAGGLGAATFVALLFLALGCGEQPGREGPDAALTRLDIPPSDLIANYLAQSSREDPGSGGGAAPPAEAGAAPDVEAVAGFAPSPVPTGTWLDLEPSHDALVSARITAAKTDIVPTGHRGDPEGLGLASPGARLSETDLEILFDKESEVVKPAYYGAVERIARRLQGQPGANLILEGHADSRGSVEYNQRLSLGRAEAVAKLLAERHGVEASRIQVDGLGEERPLTGNDSAEGRARNRRVVAVFETK